LRRRKLFSDPRRLLFGVSGRERKDVGLELMNEILVALTGLPFTPEALLRCGERVYSVEKLFNLREGFGRESDYPPQQPMSNEHSCWHKIHVVQGERNGR